MKKSLFLSLMATTTVFSSVLAMKPNKDNNEKPKYDPWAACYRDNNAA